MAACAWLLPPRFPAGERNRQMHGAALAPPARLRKTPGNITDHHTTISAGVPYLNRPAGKKRAAMSTTAGGKRPSHVRARTAISQRSTVRGR